MEPALLIDSLSPGLIWPVLPLIPIDVFTAAPMVEMFYSPITMTLKTAFVVIGFAVFNVLICDKQIMEVICKCLAVYTFDADTSFIMLFLFNQLGLNTLLVCMTVKKNIGFVIINPIWRVI